VAGKADDVACPGHPLAEDRLYEHRACQVPRPRARRGVVALLSQLGCKKGATVRRTSDGMADTSSLALAIKRSGFMPSLITVHVRYFN
jgi:hypothetical protein